MDAIGRPTQRHCVAVLGRVQGLRCAQPALRGGACGALGPASARPRFAVSSEADP